MNKEEYIQKVKSISEKISALYNEKTELNQKYIAENQSIPIGSKIVFGENKKVGWITGYDIYNDDVVPIVCPAKLDGTKSMRPIPVYRMHKEPIMLAQE